MKTLVWLGAALILTGCTSTHTRSYVEGVPFNSNNSYALNIANQTSLVDGGGLEANSPLRDFSQQEVDEVKTSVQKSYGSAAKFLGAISILTGDFTGVLDVAGGYAAEFGNTNHQAANPRWIIALDEKDFNTKEDALTFAEQEVEKASIIAFEKYGDVIRNVNKSNGAQYFEIEVNGKRAPIGIVSNPKDIVSVELGEFFYKNSVIPVDSYLIGFTGEVYSQFGRVGMPTIANNSIDDLDLREEDFYKDLTQLLPVGFYLYIPSFPKYQSGDMVYTDLEAIVPSIYHQGVKYNFIKP
ncbi:hypothetical protein [Vibrio crassostreae]|uniref:hypothetical protein n=1 Tax=Vibrio crassostreae TaxID=246167 RepID=UPI001B315365|nr:hypothetical protein [Vibrio crassostreae]